MKIGETIKSSKRNNEILLPYALFADELIPLALFTFSPFAATNPTVILSIAGRISKVSVVYLVAVPCLVDTPPPPPPRSRTGSRAKFRARVHALKLDIFFHEKRETRSTRNFEWSNTLIRDKVNINWTKLRFRYNEWNKYGRILVLESKFNLKYQIKS